MEEGFAYFAKLKPLKSTQVVRKIILARDGYQCQFCGDTLKYPSCTLDHLDPKVLYKVNGWPKGDASTYKNLVLACAPCNTKKGGRTCEEAGMFPKNKPKIPVHIRLDHHGRMYKVQAIFVEYFYSVCDTTGKITKLPSHPELGPKA